MSLAAFLCFSGGGASCVAAVEAAVVAVVAVAAFGGPAFGFGLSGTGGCDLDALSALGGGISLIVWSSDISEWCI